MRIDLATEPRRGSGASFRTRFESLFSGSVVWLVMAVGATLALAALRVAITPWFYFWDDTQLGAYGQWYELGRRLIDGSWTVLDPGAWQGGNLLAEGQWGLWSPLAWIIALGSHVFSSAAVYATVVKVILLVLLCIGTFVLARDYGASAPWAAVAAFGAAMGGQTAYMDSPSWVTGLQSFALFTWTWWALRRYVRGRGRGRGRGGPLAFLAAAYLLVTVGYVFGVIELVILFGLTLAEGFVAHRWMGLRRPLIAGVYAGLLTIVVYLPGILTAPVTVRSEGGVRNDQFLNMDISDLLAASTSTGVTTVRGFWGDVAPAPLQYITWLLPLLLIFGAGLIRRWRELLTVYGVLALTLALVLGPSEIGPLRYPVRMMPYVVLCVMILLAVLASRDWPRRVPTAGWAMVLAGAVGGAWFAWASVPENWSPVAQALAIQVGGIALLAWADRSRRPGARRWMVPGAALVMSIAVLVPQAQNFPNSPLGNFNVPSTVAAMEDVGAELPDGVFAVGDVYSLRDRSDAYSEALIANLWYLAGRDAVGVYTVLPYRQFAADLCIDLRGATCPEALNALFDVSAEIPTPLVDDLAVNAVIVIPGPGLLTPPVAPEGWTLETRDYTWLLRRDAPLPPAGGIARMTSGMRMSEVTQSDTRVSFRVDAVPQAGGQVVLSRLAWPGYAVEGAFVSESSRGYLFTIDVPPAAEGETVSIQFRPPGWQIELAAAILAAGCGALMLVGPQIHRWLTTRRGRPTRQSLP